MQRKDRMQSVLCSLRVGTSLCGCVRMNFGNGSIQVHLDQCKCAAFVVSVKAAAMISAKFPPVRVLVLA